MSNQQVIEKSSDGRTDFDFFVGIWSIQNRRRKEWLKGSDDWEEFTATTVARKSLGGLGNIDETTMEMASGRREGMTVRLFDPETRLWSLYWADSRSGTLQAPMVGHFHNGRGEFYGLEMFEGQSIFSRYIWSDITATSCRWEQAFSVDGGTSWETNWVMTCTHKE